MTRDMTRDCTWYALRYTVLHVMGIIHILVMNKQQPAG